MTATTRRGTLVTICGHTLFEPDIDVDWIVVDAGAHRGDFARTLAERYGCRCYAIEASPELFSALPETPGVKKFHYAVWWSEGEVPFNVRENPEASGVLGDGGDIVARQRVPAIDLETFARRYGLPRIDLLKLDIEGAELLALRALSDDFLCGISQITVEFHDFNGLVRASDIEVVRQRLSRLGFICVRFSLRSHLNVLFLNTRKTSANWTAQWALRASPVYLGMLRGLGLSSGRLEAGQKAATTADLKIATTADLKVCTTTARVQPATVVVQAFRPASTAVSFVIPVRDDAVRLQACLDSIAANDHPSELVDVVVVDNGSVDDSVEVARTAGARVLRRPNLRPAELRNEGAAAARGRIIAFVDADHTIDPGWTTAAIDVLTDPSIAAVGDWYSPTADSTWVQRAYDAFRRRRTGRRDVEWLASGNLAVKRDCFAIVEGFDTSLETCEDVDLCQRLRKRAYRIVTDDRLKSVHFGDPRTLEALFRGELWRGRDNLRASVRRPLTLRALPSLVIPVIDLAALALVLIGLIAVPFGGGPLLAPAGMTIGGLAALRAARMMARRRRFHLMDALGAFAVACVYDVARALALVVRAPHHRVPRTSGVVASQ